MLQLLYCWLFYFQYLLYRAIKFAKDNNKEFVHPFADDEVIAGQGTIALEILEKIEDIDQYLKKELS